MITYRQGNLLDSDAEALVNTVNTVGVMGKGIALMFKERFKPNFQEYKEACAQKLVNPGELFITKPNSLIGPKWIVNFPTKKHWKGGSKIEWIEEGLVQLRQFVENENIESIAIPPLGAGNGGLDWQKIKPLIVAALDGLPDTEVIIYEPTDKYQNASKAIGVEKLTPARAMIAELVRRYWILGMECSLLEIQKLAWFAEKNIESSRLDNPLKLQFVAHKFGPYAKRLDHLLNSLDGSYLHCDKRIADADPLDVIWFDESKREKLSQYLSGQDFAAYRPVLEETAALIDGFESPFAIELLATVDWLLTNEKVDPTVEGVKLGLKSWPKGNVRKLKIFGDDMIRVALDRLVPQLA